VRVTFGVLARYAEVDPESGLLNLTGGGIDVFGVESLSFRFTMPFVLQLRFHEAEAEQVHRVTMQVLDPRLQILGEAASFPITPKVGKYHATGWEGIFSVAGGARLMADSTGAHSVQIRIDDELAAISPFK